MAMMKKLMMTPLGKSPRFILLREEQWPVRFQEGGGKKGRDGMGEGKGIYVKIRE